MNILIASDKNYLQYYETMLFSLSLHIHEEINVYFLNSRVNADEMDRFSSIVKKYCTSFCVILMTQDDFSDYPISDVLTHETYLRLVAQFVLPNSIDRILWLDADIIIMKDISEFYYQDFGDNLLAACEDRANITESGKKIKRTLGLPDDHVYFNAGVLLLNLKLLREKNSRQSIVSACNQYKNRLIYFDQDLLNILYKDSVKYCNPHKYNCQLDKDDKLPVSDSNEIYILHYAGKKPWTFYGLSESSIYFSIIRAKQSKATKSEVKRLYKAKMIDLYQELKRYIKHYMKICLTRIAR